MFGLWAGLAKVVGATATKAIGKVAFVCAKHAPELLLGGRVLLTAGGVVAACKATVSAQDILNQYEEQEKAIKTAAAIIREKQELYKQVEKNEPEKLEERKKERDELGRPVIMAPSEYTPQNYRMELLQLKGRFIKSMAKTFALSIGLFGLATVCDIACFRTVSNRIAGLVMTCESLRRVVNAQQEKINLLSSGQRTESIPVEASVTDENGNTIPARAETVDIEEMIAPFEILWGEGATEWTPDPVINRRFLTRVETDLNDLLALRGFVTMNDVGAALDERFVPRKSWYAWGWVNKGMDRMEIKAGKTFRIVLGIDDEINKDKREFILRPNVDGFIFADIPEDEGLHEADQLRGMFSNLNGKFNLKSLVRR